MKSSAERSLTDTIRELFQASPNENIAATKIAVAKAADIINSDLLPAEEMLDKVKTSKKVPAKVAAAKNPSRKKVVAKKTLKGSFQSGRLTFQKSIPERTPPPSGKSDCYASLM